MNSKEEERLNALETHLSYVEKSAGEMNEVIISQQAAIGLLLRRVAALEQLVQALDAGNVKELQAETPPPHY